MAADVTALGHALRIVRAELITVKFVMEIIGVTAVVADPTATCFVSPKARHSFLAWSLAHTWLRNRLG